MSDRSFARLAVGGPVGLLLVSIVTMLLLYASHNRVLSVLEAPLHQYLDIALDESHFSSADNRVNDTRALSDIVDAINLELQDVVKSRWFAMYTECQAQIVGLQGTDVAGVSLGSPHRLILTRNGVDRAVDIELACQINWPIVAAPGVAILLLFCVIFYRLPLPLTAVHRRWINQLLGDGYAGEEAFSIVSAYPAQRLRFSATQQRLAESLRQSGQYNGAQVLAITADEQVKSLPRDAIPWLVLGLNLYAGDVAAAVALAQRDNQVTIDLSQRTLRIRGVEIPTSQTPLFYYAWYGLQLASGEGWVANPPSNRPDKIIGGELAALMERYDGHAKAIRDLEQSGLKARTLDQNRSKIKDDIVAVLGEELANDYLFQARRDAQGVQTSYRITLRADSINIMGESRRVSI